MSKRRNIKSSHRRGAALLEMAVCLPLFVLLVWGTVEVNDAIFKKQTLTSAAHEGALLGTRPGTTLEDIQNRVSTILQARSIEQYSVTIESGGVNMEDLPAGAMFTVQVRTDNGSDYFGLSYIDVALTARKP